MSAFVHIGIGKTGTTSIQAVLAQHPCELFSRGFLYPKAGRHGDAHYDFFDLETLGISEASFEALEAEVRNSQGARIILSSESLIFAPIPVIERLRETLGTSVRVIVYVREQVSLISSVFLQWVKVGTDYCGSIEGFLDAHQESFDYLSLIDPWSQIFGEKSIDAHVYHQAVVGTSVAKHLLDLIGIDDIPVPLEWYNPSLLPELYFAIKRLDEAAVSNSVRQQIVAELMTASVRLAGSSKLNLISQETHRRIQTLYEQSNLEFALRYLPESQRKLLTSHAPNSRP